MGSLLQLAIAPALVILFYIYIRDKYEREPLRLLFTGILFGVLITFPIIKCENLIALYTPEGGALSDAFFSSFAVAAFVEESLKYIVLFFLIWRNDNFNERFDAIVYSVFITLGFAGYENIMYVLHPELGGLTTAVSRAFISVPAHGFFAVTMGYYFAISKFDYRHHRRLYLLKAYAYPFILHGTYDFILLSGMDYMLLAFVPFVLIMWVTGFKKINLLARKSLYMGKR